MIQESKYFFYGYGWHLPHGRNGLLSSCGKGQQIMLSGWVGFCQVVWRVSLSWSQVWLASAMWREGSTYHAPRLGWLLSSCGKGQLIMLTDWVACGGRKGQLFELSRFGFCHVMGRVSFMRSVVLDTATWREGSAYYCMLSGLGLASATGPGSWVSIIYALVLGLHLRYGLKYQRVMLLG